MTDKTYICNIPLRFAVEASDIREARAIILRLYSDTVCSVPVGVSGFGEKWRAVDYITRNTVGG